MSTFTRCPNCNKSLTGFMGQSLIEQDQTDMINYQLGRKTAAYCTHCYHDFQIKANESIATQKANLEAKLKKQIQHIPLMTSPSPSAGSTRY